MQDLLSAHVGQTIGINYDRRGRPRPAVLEGTRELYFTVRPVDGTDGPVHVAFGEVAEVREGTEDHPRKAGSTPVPLVVMLRPPVSEERVSRRPAAAAAIVGLALIVLGATAIALLWSRRNQPLVALPSSERLVRVALDSVVDGLLHDRPRRRNRWAPATRRWSSWRR